MKINKFPHRTEYPTLREPAKTTKAAGALTPGGFLTTILE